MRFNPTTSAKKKGAGVDTTFAAKMAADHTKTSEELKALVSSGKVKADVPAALDSAHQGKLEKLKGLSGPNFVSNYRSMQVDAHKDAVDLFERYAKGGDNPGLKNWASKHCRRSSIIFGWRKILKGSSPNRTINLNLQIHENKREVLYLGKF